MENAELPEHRAAVVVDFFSRETVIGVKRIHSAQREFHSPSRRGKAAPAAQVRSANDDLEQNGFVRDVTALDVNLQVGQGPHEPLIKPAHSIGSPVVFVPGLIVVPRGLAEGAEHAFQIVRILQPDMFFDERDPRRLPF